MPPTSGIFSIHQSHCSWVVYADHGVLARGRHTRQSSVTLASLI